MIRSDNTISQTNLKEYFYDGINRESKDLLPPLSEEALHYLAQLLIHFSESKHLFQIKNDTLSLPTLALLYEEAYKAKTVSQRNSIIKQLGDSSLFIGALFFESFAKRGVNKDYFIGMGGLNHGGRNIFNELANSFPKLLQVVANVCAVELNYKVEDIFSLLERWQQSKNATLRKQLNSIGIIPIELNQRH
ncbi:hypothetical protein [Teredinibacter purpureus]|uniref:hypothetical protein n=1 Tax=Teredinibacter purpureus TaxID=2731756 RepID=UPI0005F826C3|nr:hypothetical protein [Teredinibacter purpureus]